MPSLLTNMLAACGKLPVESVDAAQRLPACTLMSEPVSALTQVCTLWSVMCFSGVLKCWCYQLANCIWLMRIVCTKCNTLCTLAASSYGHQIAAAGNVALQKSDKICRGLRYYLLLLTRSGQCSAAGSFATQCDAWHVMPDFLTALHIDANEACG